MKPILTKIIITISLLINSNIGFAHTEFDSDKKIFVTNPLIEDVIKNIFNEDIKVSAPNCSCLHSCNLKFKDKEFIEKSSMLISIDEKYLIDKISALKDSYSFIVINVNEVFSEVRNNEFYLDLNLMTNILDLIFNNVSKTFDFEDSKLEFYRLNYLSFKDKIKSKLNALNQINLSNSLIMDKRISSLSKSNSSFSKNIEELDKLNCVFVGNHFNGLNIKSNFISISEYKDNYLDYLDNLISILEKCKDRRYNRHILSYETPE